MARNYGNQGFSRKQKNAWGRLLLLVFAFLSGYGTAVFFDKNTIRPWIISQTRSHPVKQHVSNPVQAQSEQNLLKPKFEFYTLLANEKIGATSSATQPTASAATTAATTHVSPLPKAQPLKAFEKKPMVAATVNSNKPLIKETSYLVQVAAFKTRQDAEHLKGLLILKGFDVQVVTVSQDRNSWFRVIVGPYSNRVLAQKAQWKLAKNEGLKGMLKVA